MDSILVFYEYLRKFVDISEAEFEQVIEPRLEIRRFEKKRVITAAGEVEDHFNFIVKGLVRKYYRNGNDEVNVQIATEGHIIHAQESFHSRLPSEYYVEAIEATTMISITFENLEAVYSHSAKMERLGRMIMTHTTLHRDKWQMQMLKYSPRERFVRFVKRNADLLQRVPQKFLASYLNIQPETFSRFKHLLKNKETEEYALNSDLN